MEAQSFSQRSNHRDNDGEGINVSILSLYKFLKPKIEPLSIGGNENEIVLTMTIS